MKLNCFNQEDVLNILNYSDLIYIFTYLSNASIYNCQYNTFIKCVNINVVYFEITTETYWFTFWYIWKLKIKCCYNSRNWVAIVPLTSNSVV